MARSADSDENIRSTVAIEYPDFSTLPDEVREQFESLPTKVNGRCRSRTTPSGCTTSACPAPYR